MERAAHLVIGELCAAEVLLDERVVGLPAASTRAL